MPVNVLSSDLAYATAEEGRLVLWYTEEYSPPGFYVLVCDDQRQEQRRLGPYETEDEALDAAHHEFGDLAWSPH